MTDTSLGFIFKPSFRLVSPGLLMPRMRSEVQSRMMASLFAIAQKGCHSDTQAEAIAVAELVMTGTPRAHSSATVAATCKVFSSSTSQDNLSANVTARKAEEWRIDIVSSELQGTE
jgi:hypothetical protein